VVSVGACGSVLLAVDGRLQVEAGDAVLDKYSRRRRGGAAGLEHSGRLHAVRPNQSHTRQARPWSSLA